MAPNTPQKMLLDPAQAPMSPLAKKVPAAKRTGNTSVDMDTQLRRQSLVDLMNLAEAYPQHLDSVVRFFADKVREEQAASGIDGEAFDEVTTLGRIDEGWFCAFVASHSQLGKHEIAKFKSFDIEGIKQCIQFAMASSLQLKLPAECIQKRVMSLACSARLKEVGNRMSQWNAGFDGIDSTGRLDWGKVGVHGLFIGEEGMVSEILHKPTGHRAQVDFASGFCIFEDWELKANWSDMGAKVTKGEREQGKYFMHTFFAKDQGPHQMKQISGDSAHFKCLVAGAVQQVEQISSGLKSMTVTDDCDAVKGAIKERLQAQSKRAREMLARRKEESSCKRRVSVAGAMHST